MIEFDLDDVIVDCQTIVREGILQRTGYDITQDRQTYYVTIDGYTNKEIGEMVYEILLQNTRKMNALPGALDALEHIAKLIRRPIRIITSRRTKLRKTTTEMMQRLVKNRFKYELIFTSGQDKSPFLSKATRFFVDDTITNVNEMSKHLDNVFIMDKGWNRDAMLKSNVIRVKDLKTVARFISKMI